MGIHPVVVTLEDDARWLVWGMPHNQQIVYTEKIVNQHGELAGAVVARHGRGRDGGQDPRCQRY